MELGVFVNKIKINLFSRFDTETNIFFKEYVWEAFQKF